jgi:paired amphipathic helix protein Sin3a
MILYVNNASQHNVLERRRISEFFETFVSNFFGIPLETIRDSTGDVDRVSVEEE